MGIGIAINRDVLVWCGSSGTVRERHCDLYPREDRRMLTSIKKFLKSEDGPTAVEYAVMLALIVIVCITAIRAVGTNANSKFNDVSANLT